MNIHIKATFDPNSLTYHSWLSSLGAPRYTYEATGTHEGVQQFATGSDLATVVSDVVDKIAQLVDRHPTRLMPEHITMTLNPVEAGKRPTGVIHVDDQLDDDDVFTAAGINTAASAPLTFPTFNLRSGDT